MRLSDISRLSWDQVKRRKVVTALCAAGISIGCAAIIVAMSIGESAQLYIEKQMNSYLNMDEITVRANSSSITDSSGAVLDNEALQKGKLTRQKLDIMRQISHVSSAAPYQEFGHMQMSTLDQLTSQYSTEILGTDLDTLKDFGHSYLYGGPSDLTGTIVLNYGATLGLMDEETKQSLQEQMSGEYYNEAVMEQMNSYNLVPTALYQKQVRFLFYTPEGEKYSSPLRVVGILQKPSGVNESNLIHDKKGYVSIETAKMLQKELKIGGSDSGEFSTIIVKVDDQDYIEQVERQIRKLTVATETNLYQKERLAGEFKILKAAALGIGVFILIIASISIVVAMSMSTYQRRRQIGIMKVLGANLSQIRNLFIVEAALLGLLGGMLGVIFSYWIVWGINGLIYRLAEEQDSVIIFIPLATIPVGMAFALATGVFSGIYPAVSASRTDALTAIRRD